MSLGLIEARQPLSPPDRDWESHAEETQAAASAFTQPLAEGTRALSDSPYRTPQGRKNTHFSQDPLHVTFGSNGDNTLAPTPPPLFDKYQIPARRHGAGQPFSTPTQASFLMSNPPPVTSIRHGLRHPHMETKVRHVWRSVAEAEAELDARALPSRTGEIVLFSDDRTGVAQAQQVRRHLAAHSFNPRGTFHTFFN